MRARWIKLIAWVDEARQLWLFQKVHPDGTEEFVFRGIVFRDDDELICDFGKVEDGRLWLESVGGKPTGKQTRPVTTRGPT